MKGYGHTVKIAQGEDRELARSWCRERFGVENPNVWHTLEPGWSIRGWYAHFTRHDDWVMFALTWG
jgi:hypothetical protein